MDTLIIKKLVPLLILLAIALILPYFLPPFYVFLFSMGLVMAIATLGYNLLFGYSGLLSFGHAGFFAMGAYTAALLLKYYGITSLEILLLAAITTTLLFAAFVGFLCIRHIEIFFAVITLAFAQIFYTFVYKFYDITGGSDGIGFPTPTLLSLSFKTMPKMTFLSRVYYYYVLAFFITLTGLMWIIVNSHFGITLRAVRDNPEKAEALGISVKKHRWLAFTISGVYTGIAGVLFSPLVGHVDPTMAYWTFSGEIVIATLLGGHGFFIGPIVGGVLFIFLKNFATGITTYWQLILGGILIGICILLPGGIVGGIMYLVKGTRTKSKNILEILKIKRI